MPAHGAPSALSAARTKLARWLLDGLSDQRAQAGDATERHDDERFQLLEFTYKEVLDATKHQDDKISRLLTTIAFLTAAALALAGLDGAAPVQARFDLGHGEQFPLGLIALGGFLVGVVVAVIMLVASLSTPLRLPSGPGHTAPPVGYVKPGPNAGQVYFNEISATAVSGWFRKWQNPVADLKAERIDSLIRETHNLAHRTYLKYQRSNVAVAVLSFALMSFGMSVILVLIAADQQPSGGQPSLNAVVLTGPHWPIRAVLAAAIFLYCWLQLLYRRQLPDTVLEDAYQPGKLLSRLLRTAQPALTALVPAAMLLWTVKWRALQYGLVIGLPLLALAAVLVIERSRPAESAISDQHQVAHQLAHQSLPDTVLPPIQGAAARRLRRRRTITLSTLLALGYAAVGAYSVRANWYGIAVAAAYGYALILLALSVLQVVRVPRQRAQDFLRWAAEHDIKPLDQPAR